MHEFAMFVIGGGNAAKYLKESLAIDFNETTGDGLFTLKEGGMYGRMWGRPGMPFE